MSRATLAGSGALLLVASLLAAPGAAHAAPSIQPLKPCYVTAGPLDNERERVLVVAQGFTSNSNVEVTVDGTALPAAKAGQEGTLEFEVPAPYVERSREFAITLTEQGNPANTATATAMTTALGVGVKPRTARPSDRIRFRGSGFTALTRDFTARKPVYAHYIYEGKVRKTVRMARKPSTCGGFTARRRQIPVRHPGLGIWTIQFDQSKRYVDPAVTPIVYVRLAIRVRLERRR
jgi:hypothetical protein